MSDSIPHPSTPPVAVIERGLNLFLNLVQAHTELAVEFSEARGEFQGSGLEPDPKADRRLLEWFLFERPSAVFEGAAGLFLAESWLDAADASLKPMLSGLLESRVGIFEVTSIEPAHGIWVRDLSGVGEYPLSEPEAASEFVAGDLVIGRLYPIGDGVFQASSVAASIRNIELGKALKKDMEVARDERRGVPRISQQTIESMFFTSELAKEFSISNEAAEEVPELTPKQIIADGQEWLRSEGLTRGEVEELFEALASEPCPVESIAPGAQDMLGGILNELAFHSEIDLSAARAKLIAVWNAMWTKAPQTSETTQSTSKAERLGEKATDEHTDKARKALEAFDSARAAGGDIEEVFRQLESDLNLEPEETDDGEDKVPDFPGVVAAMVEEFLWESSLTEEAKVKGDALRRFAEFASHIGAFEDIAHQDLLLYSGCWLIERGQLKDAEDARSSLFALEQFCRWAEREHEIALWSMFATSFAKLWESVPRLVTANAMLGNTNSNNRVLLYQVDSTGKARRVDTVEASYDLQPELADLLREGDLVRGARSDGTLEVYGCYPDEVRGILQPSS